MSKQVLIIEPQNELKFKVDGTGTFKGYTTFMKLTNPTNDVVLFKIKTTAPKKYCVRPNSGFLDPQSRTDIAITPQPVYVDANEKNKHKFMVQSVVAPEGNTNIEQVWKEINASQLMDSKLKCVFEMPPGAPATGEATEGGASPLPEATKKKVAVFNDAKALTATPKEGTDNPAQIDATKKRFDNEDIKATKKTENESFNYAGEFERLRDEESKLRQENLRLQDELMRLRSSASGDGKVIGKRHSYEPPEKTQMMKMPIMLIAFGVGILGIIIGKFFI